MKKLLWLFILPFVALGCLAGCGKDHDVDDLKKLYESMKTAYVVEDEETGAKTNIFFASEEKPNTITLAYTDDINVIVNSVPNSSTTDLEKRMIALDYHQQILNSIFNFYENNQEEFYKEMSSADYKKSEMNDLYNSLEKLKDTLDDFKTQYIQFVSSFESNDIMEFNVFNYTYELNRVLDSSFDFMYEFIDVYDKYVASDDKLTTASINYRLDVSYVDVANIVYLDNIKPFDYSVGNRGLCDLVSLVSPVASKVEANITSYLLSPKKLSDAMTDGLNESSASYGDTVAQLNDFFYSRDLLTQRLGLFRKFLSRVDAYKLNQYRFGLVSGVDYDTYKASLSASDSSDVSALENYIADVFKPFVEKLKLIVA